MLHLQYFGNLIPGSPTQWALADSCDSPSSSRSEPDAAYEGIAWHTRYSCKPPTPIPWHSFLIMWIYLSTFLQGPWKINIETKLSVKAESLKIWRLQPLLRRSIMSPGRGGVVVSPHELWHVTWRLLKHRNWGGGSNRGGLWPMWRALKTIFVAPE